MDIASWLRLIALALLWGSSFFFMEVALTDIGPVTLVFGRVVLAALALVLLPAARHPHHPDARADGRLLRFLVGRAKQESA